ncbi:hypothetical protein IGI04_003147 [Brassica rapa subsp. trilocularis]|uniref:Histone deacetylase interacting domain-containing protein n=1 Tax=Brassica rapa subsp. trilocularis TaxID=1813537 RepID=A0ABQ7NXL7_BRACM|nr:hypothetical protein IGI04_003147 [Brassica rapa subsp. trilocularis]
MKGFNTPRKSQGRNLFYQTPTNCSDEEIQRNIEFLKKLQEADDKTLYRRYEGMMQRYLSGYITYIQLKRGLVLLLRRHRALIKEFRQLLSSPVRNNSEKENPKAELKRTVAFLHKIEAEAQGEETLDITPPIAYKRRSSPRVQPQERQQAKPCPSRTPPPPPPQAAAAPTPAKPAASRRNRAPSRRLLDSISRSDCFPNLDPDLFLQKAKVWPRGSGSRCPYGASVFSKLLNEKVWVKVFDKVHRAKAVTEALGESVYKAFMDALGFSGDKEILIEQLSEMLRGHESLKEEFQTFLIDNRLLKRKRDCVNVTPSYCIGPEVEKGSSSGPVLNGKYYSGDSYHPEDSVEKNSEACRVEKMNRFQDMLLHDLDSFIEFGKVPKDDLRNKKARDKRPQVGLSRVLEWLCNGKKVPPEF